MLTVRFFSGIFCGVIALGISTAPGQSYPNKPIRMVTGEAGGGIDVVARLMAQGLTSSLGQQVIVENRGGASGIIVAQTAAKASPDGYTLLTLGTLWLLPLLQDNVPYDPVRDFSPISLMAVSPNLLVVHPSVSAKSVKELIELAKAKPGVLNYASSSTGGSGHLAAELFKAMAGVNIVRISYKGSGPASNALLAGEVQLSFSNAGAVTSHIKSGRLRALAVTTAQPSELFPGLPTVAASGLPGYDAATVFGILAPAKTPATLIKRLNQESVRFLNSTDAKEKFLNIGIETVGSSPEEFSAFIKSDVTRMGKVIKNAGIRAE